MHHKFFDTFAFLRATLENLMSQNTELATGRLYGANALGVKNIKLFPGSSRDTTAEQIAEQIQKSLSRLEAGDFEEVSPAAE